MTENSLPIRILGRKLAAENARFRIYFDHVVGTHGNEVPNYLVVEAREQTGDCRVTGVTVIPKVEDRFGLVQVYRVAMREYFWEAARGFIDHDELPFRSAIRELEEETGYSCEESDLVALGYLCPEPSTLVARTAMFVAEQCRPVPRPHNDDLGIGQVHFFNDAEIRALLRDGKLDDASTTACYLRYAMGIRSR